MTEHPLPTPGDDATLTGPQTPTPQRVAAVRALRELLAAGYGTEARPIASYGAPRPAPSAASTRTTTTACSPASWPRRSWRASTSTTCGTWTG